ncbi:aspartate aminotransferase [Sulfobacillus acidophilus TPY]|uniref:Aminotransferase n=1 Tax=Sulfobacillus acidophilus (strain ATCC 700253 / DSM 10332 / NAL) TaxID=679936 RepID=G8TXM4_SULAD|nr:aspartate aminotransferase [Sulfobacillus acidophilus TPY]AEW04980.1 L-aspartate aminotransferase apoenzyme [Sulfobacillus acidophilus DSM 10332]
MLKVASRLADLAPSPTMALDAKTKALIAQGVDVVNLTAGEPDFDTPDHIRQAAVEAIEKGQTRYTPVGGTPALKAAVARQLAEDTGNTYAADEILVSAGAKHSLYNAVMALVEPGDGVLLPVPYWVTYPEQIRLARGEVQLVTIDPAHQGALEVEDVQKAIRPNTRGVILNSPSNPSGAVIRPEALRAIAELAVERDLWVISDEIYGQLVYDNAVQTSIASMPGMRDRTIVINGVSKAYAMTGWRIGYAAGPKAIIQAMANLQSQSTSNPTSIAQAAAVAALTGPQEPVERMRQEFDRRRRFVLSRMQNIPGLTAVEPKGAFYLWVDMSGLKGRTIGGREIRNADDLALSWLEEARVSVVPGSGFGMPDFFRMSYATSIERLDTGLQRMAALLEG